MDLEILRNQALSGDKVALQVYRDAMMDQGFSEALANFLAKWNDLILKHYQTKFPMLTPKFVTSKLGNRYAKIIKDGSAYAFIDMQTGDIFKSASWAQPAKYARGNIYDPNPVACCGPYGVTYLR